jgi:hypothetical protein
MRTAIFRAVDSLLRSVIQTCCIQKPRQEDLRLLVGLPRLPRETRGSRHISTGIRVLCKPHRWCRSPPPSLSFSLLLISRLCQRVSPPPSVLSFSAPTSPECISSS